MPCTIVCLVRLENDVLLQMEDEYNWITFKKINTPIKIMMISYNYKTQQTVYDLLISIECSVEHLIGTSHLFFQHCNLDFKQVSYQVTIKLYEKNEL